MISFNPFVVWAIVASVLAYFIANGVRYPPGNPGAAAAIALLVGFVLGSGWGANRV